MPLKSMKLTDADRKKEKKSFLADTQKFPFGLRVDLGEEALKKLGMTDLPEVGDTKILAALVEVTSVSKNDHGDGENRHVGLQITEMALEENDAQKKDKLKLLYKS